ncbi:MAG TPA: Sb-PDE family phosphodiesterase [Saprospiraceae bacterium]|nr:Sb-PDE family phosphodiesterase [Saprospiraceae bacterium]HMQ84289.1 Sb-PDE family phosphodiesterase [Saprospiraceae bacterium]
MKHLLWALFLVLYQTAFTQSIAPHAHSRAIHFPDVAPYQTMVCDFHQHTVFSDGSVWPDIRVQEALKDSVDAISLTEHLEYQPHLADIPHSDRNRSYDLATDFAKPYDLIVVRGAEITRKMPPGHINAIFIEDANRLMIEDSIEVFREARRQGAFTFWNHPNWIAQYKDGVAKVTGMHHFLMQEGLLNGIEVVNDLTYSDEALRIALDYNLTIMGTSDVHGLVDWQYKVADGGHRPVTLVFTTERSPEAIKEGLENKRTVVWYNNNLIGRESELIPLLNACLKVTKVSYQGISAVATVSIYNDSDALFILMNNSDFQLHADTDVVMLHPNTTTSIEVKTKEQLEDFELKFQVLNAVTAPGEHPSISLEINQ